MGPERFNNLSLSTTALPAICSCPIHTAFSGIPPKAVIGLVLGSINRATTFLFTCRS